MSIDIASVGGQETALELRDVTKSYPGGVVAVDGVDLAVRDQEFLTILGPSGSGKTTMLKLIAGFIAPTTGTIMIGGEDVSRTPPYKRNLGMVFQNYALFPHLTVEENLAFPLEMRRIGKSEASQRVEEALGVVRLEGMGDRYPRQLSGGQQQRVALARAIVYRPRVLLMDEPLGALDRRLREDLQLEFKRLHQELDVTVLYVTHDQEEALLLSDRIAILHNGRIEQLGSGEDLYQRPISPFVGSFIGDSNIFRGTFQLKGGLPSIRHDGATLHGSVHPDAQLKPGDEAVLIVRPEDCIIDFPSAHTDANSLEVVVDQVVYLGSAIKYVVDYQGMSLYSRMPPKSGAAFRQPGAKVSIRWAADDAVIVPNDDGSKATSTQPG